ncbi:flagellar motor switch protein FliN [Nocardioides sp.]|uniref:flagellar motor switch protein FliN n=1 Tax=Nocardioides sp. TaxID=35761 RepID=UPI003515FC35
MTMPPLPADAPLTPELLIAQAVAAAAAPLLPAAEPLSPGDPQPGTEHVAGLFAAAATSQVQGLAGPATLTILVGEDLVEALQGSPLGPLDVAAAVQPALDAAALALGGAAAGATEVAMDLVVDAQGGPFVAVPLLGAGISGAVLVPDATLMAAAQAAQAAQAGGGAPEPAASATGLPPQVGAAGTIQTQPVEPAPGAGATVHPISGSRRGIEMLHGVEMEVTVELGRTRMAVRDLLNLAPGAVLALDRAAGSPADLLVNGRLIARGEVVVVDEDFGLRITEILDQTAVG